MVSSPRSDATQLVSVVIPAYNASAHIRETLESVASQHGPFNIEIIVVDDGSTDETRDIVKAFGGVRLVCQANAGPSAARNRGIAESTGNFVAFLDADDLWPAGKLTAQMNVFDAHPDVDMVFGDCRIFTADGPRAQTLFESEQLDRRFWGDAALVTDAYTKLFRLNYVPTGAAIIRRRCFDIAGRFDEARRYVEDMDLWFRIALHCQVGYTTHLCELKREHPGNISGDWEKMTLAFIDVLRSQQQQYPDEIRRRGINIGRRIAFEYSLMGDKRERNGDIKLARHRYLQAFRAYPSLRPLYYWLRTWTPAYNRTS